MSFFKYKLVPGDDSLHYRFAELSMFEFKFAENIFSSKNPIHFREQDIFIELVPGERLELSHRKATASKTVVSTISPPGQVCVSTVYGK